jgi:RNA polymerase sigma-70 factor (ECF subfamily)
MQGESLTEQDTIRNEMNTCIREFIQRLPESYSAVLVLSELEGYSNKEIAGILDISLEAVKIRLHRARVRLKVELSQGCQFSHNRDNVLECQRREKN